MSNRQREVLCFSQWYVLGVGSTPVRAERKVRISAGRNSIPIKQLSSADTWNKERKENMERNKIYLFFCQKRSLPTLANPSKTRFLSIWKLNQTAHMGGLWVVMCGSQELHLMILTGLFQLGIFYDAMFFSLYLLFSLLFPFFAPIFNTECPDLAKETCRQCLLRLHSFSQS